MCETSDSIKGLYAISVETNERRRMQFSPSGGPVTLICYRISWASSKGSIQARSLNKI